MPPLVLKPSGCSLAFLLLIYWVSIDCPFTAPSIQLYTWNLPRPKGERWNVEDTRREDASRNLCHHLFTIILNFDRSLEWHIPQHMVREVKFKSRTFKRWVNSPINKEHQVRHTFAKNTALEVGWRGEPELTFVGGN